MLNAVSLLLAVETVGEVIEMVQQSRATPGEKQMLLATISHLNDEMMALIEQQAAIDNQPCITFPKGKVLALAE